MSLQGLPSVLISTIAEFLDIKSFSRLILTCRMVKNDLKDNWVKMAQRDLGVTREEFNRVIKDEGLSPSYLYYLMYLNQRETVKRKIELKKGFYNHDAYDVFIDFRDDNINIESFLNFDKKLSLEEKQLHDKVVSKYSKNWTHNCTDDAEEVLRFFYKTYDKDKAFVMAFSYPWLTRRYENIGKIEKILGNYDIAKYLAGRGIEPCDVKEEMKDVMFQCVTFPPFHGGLLYEDADLSYKKTFTPLFDLDHL